MVKRLNGRFSDVFATRRYDSLEDLVQALKRYCWLYNHHALQVALQHQKTIATMKELSKNSQIIFYKKLVNHAGPDMRDVIND